MEDTFKFKRKGNRIKFEFNLQILQIVQNLSLALSNSDTSEASDFCNDLTAKLKRRNKVINTADRLVLGWDTVAEYEADPIASDSDHEKKIRQAENRALTKRKTETSTKLTLGVSNQKPSCQWFQITLNITASHHPVNETSTLDFHLTILPRTATFDLHNGPVAQMLDRGTRALVVAKEKTSINTARTPDTETKVEGIKIDNELSDLSNDYTIQEF